MAMTAATSLPPGFGGISMTRPHENPPPRFRRSRGKRVSWAAADQLCQTRMFLAEDAPFLAGIAQEQLQVKTSSFMHLADDLPPGFGGNVFGGGVTSCMRPDSQALAASVAAAISWRCPQKIALDPAWEVRAGEESKEIEMQKQRESKTLEAVYPRASTIPTSPLEPMEPPAFVDDSRIPLIPVAPLDEDDGDDNKNSQGMKRAGTNEAPVANYVNEAALTNGAMVNTSVKSPMDQGALAGIDTNLLLQLLANPSLVETLSGVRNISMVNTSIGNGSTQSIENITSNPLNQSVYPPPYGGPPPPPTITSLSSTSTWTPPFQQPVHVQAPVGLPPAIPGPRPVTQIQTPVTHIPAPVVPGTHTNGNQFVPGQAPVVPNGNQFVPGQQFNKQFSSQQEFNKREGGKGYRNYVNNDAPPGYETSTGFRSKKPCLFYNTGKGCRNGLKCPFVHDLKTDKGVYEMKKFEKGVNDNKGQKRRREDMEERRRGRDRDGERDRDRDRRERDR